MHGDGYTEEAYAAALPELLATLRRNAPRARILFATTTDVRERNDLEKSLPKTERMIRRNEIAIEFARKEKIPIDDLFAVVRNHPEYHAADGVHFTDKGYDALAAQVVKELIKVLP
jgi:lysophospholipase L1-like esterase